MCNDYSWWNLKHDSQEIASFSAEIDVLSPSLLVAGPDGLIQNFNQEQIVSSQESFSVLFCVFSLLCFSIFKSISHPNGLVMSGVIGLTTSQDPVSLRPQLLWLTTNQCGYQNQWHKLCQCRPHAWNCLANAWLQQQSSLQSTWTRALPLSPWDFPCWPLAPSWKSTFYP